MKKPVRVKNGNPQ